MQGDDFVILWPGARPGTQLQRVPADFNHWRLFGGQFEWRHWIGLSPAEVDSETDRIRLNQCRGGFGLSSEHEWRQPAVPTKWTTGCHADLTWQAELLPNVTNVVL